MKSYKTIQRDLSLQGHPNPIGLYNLKWKRESFRFKEEPTDISKNRRELKRNKINLSSKSLKIRSTSKSSRDRPSWER